MDSVCLETRVRRQTLDKDALMCGSKKSIRELEATIRIDFRQASRTTSAGQSVQVTNFFLIALNMDNEEFPVRHFVRVLSVGFNDLFLVKRVSVTIAMTLVTFVQRA